MRKKTTARSGAVAFFIVAAVIINFKTLYSKPSEYVLIALAILEGTLVVQGVVFCSDNIIAHFRLQFGNSLLLFCK